MLHDQLLVPALVVILVVAHLLLHEADTLADALQADVHHSAEVVVVADVAEAAS